VLAIEIKDVEDVIKKCHAFQSSPLKRGKPRDLAFHCDNLSIHDEALRSLLQQRLDQLGKCFIEPQLVARVEIQLLTLSIGETPDSIELRFEDPRGIRK